MRKAFLICVLLLAAPELRAEPAVVQAVQVGVNQHYFWGARVTPAATSIDVAWLRDVGFGSLAAPVTFAVGLRTAGTGPLIRVPLEGYGRALLNARFGPWMPAAGFELGVSGYNGVVTNWAGQEGVPDPTMPLIQDTVSPAYVAFVAAPARFRFHGFRVSALELVWGSTLWPPGAAARLHLGWLSVAKEF